MPPHCDALDGPVVKAASHALQEGDVRRVLSFVPKEAEAEVEEVYAKVVRAREQGPEARELADRHFFETVVRLHRAGEGAPYTGLKPAGLDHGPVIPVAETAIDSGDPAELLTVLTDAVRAEVRKRFHHAMELQAHAEDDVDAARAYVEAMLGLQVYSHALYQFARSGPHHGEHQHAA